MNFQISSRKLANKQTKSFSSRLNPEHKSSISFLSANHLFFLVTSMLSVLAGVVPEQEGEMEEKRAFWSDAAGPNTLLDRLRASSAHAS